jgi:hypothetical protein
MSDDDMYWADKYPWSRRPAPRTPARAPVMFKVILMLLRVVVRRTLRESPPRVWGHMWGRGSPGRQRDPLPGVSGRYHVGGGR